MSRRARGMSVSQKPATATASAPQTKTEDASGHKRKLSENAVAQEDAKKSKPAPEDNEDEDEDKGEDDEENKDEDEDEGEGDMYDEDDDDEEEVEDADGKDPQLDDGRPHVFYLWADGVTSLIQFTIDHTYVVRKSRALEAYRKVAHLPEEEREDAIEPHIGTIVNTWVVRSSAKERKTPGAKGLVAKFKEGHKARAKAGNGKDGDGHSDWWYEVTLDRERPKDDTPHIQVSLEDAGIWYLTDIKPADMEGDAAMSAIVNWTATAAD